MYVHVHAHMWNSHKEKRLKSLKSDSHLSKKKIILASMEAP